jgi:hypothetical protein
MQVTLLLHKRRRQLGLNDIFVVYDYPRVVFNSSSTFMAAIGSQTSILVDYLHAHLSL